MNFEWKRDTDEGQEATGFLQVYRSEVQGLPAMAVLHYLAQMPDSDFDQDAHITLFIAGTSQQVTDGLFHWIFDDLSDIVTLQQDSKFPKGGKPLEYMATQTFLVDELPSIHYFTHGDYGIAHH